jgi:hypothetical protein
VTNSSEKDIYAYNRPEFTYEQIEWIFHKIEKWYLDWWKIAIDGKMNFEKEGEIQFFHAKDALLNTLTIKDGELNVSGKLTFRDIPVKYRSYILNQDGTLSCPYCEKVVNCA